MTSGSQPALTIYRLPVFEASADIGKLKDYFIFAPQKGERLDSSNTSILLLAELLLFVVANALHLGSRATLLVKDVTQPLLCELPSELNTDDSLSEAQDLAVVGQDGTLNGEWVVRCDSSDTLDLVGSDGDTKTGSTDKDTSVCFACLDLAGGLDSKVWVC